MPGTLMDDHRRCQARSKRTHTQCGRAAASGATVCHMHGGKTPRGLASPSWQHGRYSKTLPPGLADAYERARRDPELIALRDELALVDARLVSLLEGLATGETAAAWTAIYAAIELRRRLADTERRRVEMLQTVVTAEQALALVGALAASVRKHVQDRAILAAITADIEVVLRSRPELAAARDTPAGEMMAADGVS